MASEGWSAWWLVLVVIALFAGLYLASRLSWGAWPYARW